MRARRRLFIIAATLLGLVVVIAALTGSHGGADLSRTAAFDRTADEQPAEEVYPGEQEILALAAAYPGRISRAEVRDGEWAIEMDGVWYYWADGRLLPDELRSEAEAYTALRFCRYQLGPPQEREIDPELERVLEDRTSVQTSGETDERERFNDFLDTLYRISSREDAERIVRRIEFLGTATRVHPLLVEPLERIERTILALIPHDAEVAAFVRGVTALHGYNWRTIAGTVRRSYHSYGVAVDFVPRSYGGRWPYWLWAAQGGMDQWWAIPTESRWQIPQPVIDAFESNGFVWGGKWLFFDNLHFEYRPESILMAERADPT
jgi:hypothetical protein